MQLHHINIIITTFVSIILLSTYGFCEAEINHENLLNNPLQQCEAPFTTQKSPTVIGLSGKLLSTGEIDDFMNSRMAAMNIPGLSFAIINDGEVAYHRAMGTADVNTGELVTGCSIFQGASITKPLFAYLVMTFVEEGALNLDRPLYEYLAYPDIEHDERYKKITARMVLTHQSGFPNWRTDYPDKKLFIQFEPGTEYAYSGEGYQYLSLVLQKVAGVDDAGLEAIFQKRVARPFGLTNTQVIPDKNMLGRTTGPHVDGKLVSVESPNSYSNFGAAYGVHSEALDFSKWLIALMNRQGLSEAMYNQFFQAQQVPIPVEVGNPFIVSQDYALGFVIYETPLGPIYVHGGNNPGYTSLIGFEKDQKWGVVLFTNANQVSAIGLELMAFLNF